MQPEKYIANDGLRVKVGTILGWLDSLIRMYSWTIFGLLVHIYYPEWYTRLVVSVKMVRGRQTHPFLKEIKWQNKDPRLRIIIPNGTHL